MTVNNSDFLKIFEELKVKKIMEVETQKKRIEKFKEAIIDGDLDTVKELHALGVDLKIDKNFAVIEASVKSYEAMVKYLCENGVDVTDQDNLAIRTASVFRYFSIMTTLIKHGADIDAIRPDYKQNYNKYLEIINAKEMIIQRRLKFEREISNTGKLIKAVKAKKIKKINGLKI